MSEGRDGVSVEDFRIWSIDAHNLLLGLADLPPLILLNSCSRYAWAADEITITRLPHLRLGIEGDDFLHAHAVVILDDPLGAFLLILRLDGGPGFAKRCVFRQFFRCCIEGETKR